MGHSQGIISLEWPGRNTQGSTLTPPNRIWCPVRDLLTNTIGFKRIGGGEPVSTGLAYQASVSTEAIKNEKVV